MDENVTTRTEKTIHFSVALVTTLITYKSEWEYIRMNGVMISIWLKGKRAGGMEKREKGREKL